MNWIHMFERDIRESAGLHNLFSLKEIASTVQHRQHEQQDRQDRKGNARYIMCKMR
jgi:hypothetical protein